MFENILRVVGHGNPVFLGIYAFFGLSAVWGLILLLWPKQALDRFGFGRGGYMNNPKVLLVCRIVGVFDILLFAVVVYYIPHLLASPK
jgi:hypothetical protein